MFLERRTWQSSIYFISYLEREGDKQVRKSLEIGINYATIIIREAPGTEMLKKAEAVDIACNYYKNLGYETIIKHYQINNKKFLEELKEYDNIISNTNDLTVLSSLISQVLMKYEEVVINGENKGNTTK